MQARRKERTHVVDLGQLQVLLVEEDLRSRQEKKRRYRAWMCRASTRLLQSPPLCMQHILELWQQGQGVHTGIQARLSARLTA